MKIFKIITICFLLLMLSPAISRVNEREPIGEYVIVANQHTVDSYENFNSLEHLKIGIIKDESIEVLNGFDVTTYQDSTLIATNLYTTEIDIMVIAVSDWHDIKQKRLSYMSNRLTVVDSLNNNLLIASVENF